MRNYYELLDLFSGAGGFARGFEEAGYRPVVGVDNFPPAAKTYKLNFPGAYFIADDIKEVNAALIRDYTGYGRGDVSVIIASPPCEPFTGANPRRQRNPLDRLYRDPAGQLFLHAIRIIGEVRPAIFVIENVAGILEHPIQAAIRRELATRGYRSVYFNVLKAEDYGTPSHRVRVFVSNIRIEPKKRRAPSVEEALRGLPPPGAPYPFNHEAPLRISKRYSKRLARLRWGESLIKYTGAGGRKLPNYIRLDPRGVAPTVMGSSRFIHPYEDRLLTVREQARLMGFPDYHIFTGSRDAQYDMVGEAVPPPLAKAIAEAITRELDRR
ncbi:MAG: DNA cytosine methyltransferase [Desulfurococcales archaeon]|nr:DNA cytosine methyltransferase [Desulfurococcales archaeon]